VSDSACHKGSPVRGDPVHRNQRATPADAALTGVAAAPIKESAVET
jgi:hypothetical protein